jgi:iron(III) transport system ATP-binding protein
MSLVLRDLTKEFSTQGQPTHKAVDHIYLEMKKGLFYTLLGPSGCGKTTLLRMIAGFETPTSGAIVYNGKRINEVPAFKRGFPMVFQSYALFPHMSVYENIAYGLKLKKLSRDEIDAKVRQAIELLNLQGQETKHPFQMSGGQQQRVALARAMVMEPEIILFDEPLSNLDARLRLFMRDEIRALQKRLGITAIYVTHDQEEAMAISDQIVVLNAGQIEQQGTPFEIYQRPATEFVARFFGCPNVFPIEADGERIRILDEFYELREERERLEAANRVVVRSDSIALSRDHGRHRARVENMTFLGSRTQYTLVGPHDQRIAVDLPWTGEGEPFKAGEEVRFDLKPEFLHFLAVTK